MGQVVHKKLLRCMSNQTFMVFIALLVASGFINVWRGQDNWWDVINYHIDNPWNLLHHRWTKDLFASGIQGYFHPLLDIPYYLLSMVWLPNHPRIVSFLAGLPYGCLVFVTYLIVRRLISAVEGVGRGERIVVTIMAVALSVTGVSVWTQAGTTTNEVTISTLVLLAVYILVRNIGERKKTIPAQSLLAMGALVGLAASFKLTAAVYAPALGLVILGVSPNVKAAFRSGFLYALGWFVVFGAVYGPWAWHLYSLTGNPMFPMFNNIFHSPFSAAVGGREKISIPKNVWQWLFYPFFWLDLKHPTVYNELSFRDARVLLFYVAAMAYILDYAIRCIRGKAHLVPRKIRIVVAFSAISYVVWLVIFSMLRYAIVIEVTASLLFIVLVWSVATRVRIRHGSVLRIFGLATLVTVVMSTTVYPSVGRINYSASVYSASVPKIDKNALVVLANQPMGLLAPLIHHADKSSVYIGLPNCFMKGEWCYNGFYHYGLGRQLRQKLAHHDGPIYVAYYTNRMPIMPQLALFRLTVDYGDCARMTTNATADVAICRAQYIPQGRPMPKLGYGKEKLALDIRYNMQGIHIDGTWEVNTCGSVASLGKLKFKWHAPDDIGYVHIFLQVPPSNDRVSFAAGGSNGTAITGLWVRAAQTFIFTSKSGKTIATATTEYEPCESP